MPESRQEIWTYIGRRLWNTKVHPPQLAYVWLDEQGEHCGYTKNIVPYARPGGQFRVKIVGPGSVRVKGDGAPEYVEMHHDAEQIAAWGAAEAADLAVRRQAKAAKNDMSPDRLRELLAPLAEEYQSRNAEGRTALIATVIRYMTDGRS